MSAKNEGIAFALNRILDIAEKNNFKWCLTMDQDSICDPDLIFYYKKCLDLTDVALISPFILNNSKWTLKEYNKIFFSDNVEKIKKPIDCITSGTLNNVNLVKKVGGYNEKLFIDFVDTELNCRILKNNFKILKVNSTYLIQRMGVGKKVLIFDWLYNKTRKNLFRRLKVVSVYSDKRLYYASRNSRFVRKNYYNHGFRTSFMFMFMYYLFITIFFPKNRSRIKMWKNIFTGFLDYKKINDFSQ